MPNTLSSADLKRLESLIEQILLHDEIERCNAAVGELRNASFEMIITREETPTSDELDPMGREGDERVSRYMNKLTKTFDWQRDIQKRALAMGLESESKPQDMDAGTITKDFLKDAKSHLKAIGWTAKEIDAPLNRLKKRVNRRDMLDNAFKAQAFTRAAFSEFNRWEVLQQTLTDLLACAMFLAVLNILLQHHSKQLL